MPPNDAQDVTSFWPLELRIVRFELEVAAVPNEAGDGSVPGEKWSELVAERDLSGDLDGWRVVFRWRLQFGSGPVDVSTPLSPPQLLPVELVPPEGAHWHSVPTQRGLRALRNASVRGELRDWLTRVQDQSFIAAMWLAAIENDRRVGRVGTADAVLALWAQRVVLAQQAGTPYDTVARTHHLSVGTLKNRVTAARGRGLVEGRVPALRLTAKGLALLTNEEQG